MPFPDLGNKNPIVTTPTKTAGPVNRPVYNFVNTPHTTPTPGPSVTPPPAQGGAVDQTGYFNTLAPSGGSGNPSTAIDPSSLQGQQLQMQQSGVIPGYTMPGGINRPVSDPNAPQGTTGGSTGSPPPQMPSFQQYLDIEAQAVASRRAQAQGMIDQINQGFAAQMSEQQALSKEEIAQSEAQARAQGLTGSDIGAANILKTKEGTLKQEANLRAQQGAEMARILMDIDKGAQQSADQYLSNITAFQENQQQFGLSKAEFDSRQQQQQLQNQQTMRKSFSDLASTSPLQWNDLVQKDPQTAQKLLTETGYDSSEAAFRFNAAKAAGQQVQWSAPQQTPGGLLFYGKDPATGQIVQQTVPINFGVTNAKITNDGSLIAEQNGKIVQYLGNGNWGDPSQTNFGVAPAGLKLLRNADGSQSLVDAYTGLPITGTPSQTSTSSSSTSGSISFQTNNPGNIKFGAFAQSLGATDSGIAAKDGGTFAKFSTADAGISAQKSLLTSGAYANLTFDQAMKQWSNGAYGAEIAPSVDPKTMMSGMTPPQLDLITNAQKQREGWTPSPNAMGTTGSSIVDATLPGYSTKIVGNTQMTQATIDKAAMQYNITGSLPGGSRSTTGLGGLQNAAIKNRAGELDPTGNMAAHKAELGSLSSTLTQQTQYLNTMQRSVNTVDSNLQILQDAVGKVNNYDSPLINEWQNQVTSRVIGSGDLASFKAAIQTVRTEYGNILSRGGAQTDTVRNEAATLIPENITKSQLMQVIATLQAEGKNVISSATKQVASVQDQINNIAQPSTLPPATQTPTGGSESDPLGIL